MVISKESHTKHMEPGNTEEHLNETFIQPAQDLFWTEGR